MHTYLLYVVLLYNVHCDLGITDVHYDPVLFSRVVDPQLNTIPVLGHRLYDGQTSIPVL